MLSTNLDGLIIAGEPDDAVLAAWTGTDGGRRLAEQRPGGRGLVANDDEMGGRIAADHLLGLGHRTIGHLTGTGGPAAHRRAGFVDRMVSAGLELHLAGVDRGTSEEDGYLAAGDLLDRRVGVTAIFAANDTMALGALAAIRERGRSVPADISVIGYDNSPLARSRYLDITSIDDRSDVVGAAAGRALLARFDDPAISRGER